MSERQFRRKYSDYDEKYYVNAVEIAKKMIFDFVRDYFGEEKLNEVKGVIDNFPIHYFDAASFRNNQKTNRDTVMDEFVSEAYVDSMQLNLPKSYTRVFSPDLIAYEKAITTTIHEYGHVLRRVNSKYGNMFEEGFVTIFAEACYTHSKLKSDINYNPNEINISTDGNYSKAESQVRAILYFLNQRKVDISLIGEYIFGNENVFLNKCVEIFGEEFINYFKLANSSNDQYYNNYNDKEKNSEVMLINLLSKYINNNPYLSSDNKYIYVNNSLTLSKAISNSNINLLTEKDSLIYQKHQQDSEISLEEEKDERQERVTRIRNYVLQKCNLEGKSKNEIYDIILNICIEYIKRNDSDRIENKIFIQELKSYIPKIEEIVNIFRVLRSNGFMNLDFSKLNNTNITYDDIYNSLNNTYKKFKENKKEELSHIFDKCISKDDLFKIIGVLESVSNIVDVESIFPNYSNFVKYVNVVSNEIPVSFNNKMNDYNSIYTAILNMYLLHQERELLDLKKIESEYTSDVSKLDKQFRVIENRDDFDNSIKIDNELHASLDSLNEHLNNEEQINKGNEEKRNDLYSEHSNLKRKNFIIRIFQRKKIKNIEIQIKEIENKISECNSSIHNIENDISSLNKRVKDNEKILLDKYGISISEYKSLLDEIKSNGLTEEEITKRLLEIQKKIQSLNIKDKEKEIRDIYANNSAIINNKEDIEKNDNLKK